MTEKQKQEIKEKIQDAVRNLKEGANAWEILSYVFRELSWAIKDEEKRFCLEEIKNITGKDWK